MTKIKKASNKLDLLARSSIEDNSFHKPHLIYNPYGERAKIAYQKTAETIRTHEDGSTLSGPEVEILKDYLRAFSEGEVPVYSKLYFSVSFIEKFDEANNTSHYGEVAPAVFSKALALLNGYGDQAVKLDQEASASNLSSVSAFIFRRATGDNALAIDEILEHFFYHYRNNHRHSLIALFQERYDITTQGIQYFAILRGELQVIMEKANPAMRVQYAEGLYMGFLSVCLRTAKYFNDRLDGGHGFHNLADVNKAMEEAASATEVFKSLGIVGTQTRGIEFEKLAKMFRALKFDRNGAREFGGDIAVAEIVENGQANRPGQTDPYSLIEAYLLQQISQGANSFLGDGP